MGIPTMMVTRGGFSQVVGNAFAGIGFSAEGPTVYEFPVEMFIGGSDLTPINENIDKIVYGLTKWEPKIKEKGAFTPPKVTLTGKDYQEAAANMNLLFLKNMWADGLPLLPATEESVNWILTGTDLSHDTVIGEGKILPRGGIPTVESLAVALAMAGGRPEYFPLLIAAVEAITDPICKHQSWNATTCSVYPTVIVNGPIAKQIRLNSGYGCLGPDPNHSAGGPIGRAIRIILQDMGGAIPGVGTMAIYGGPARYTGGPVFAEDEDGLPQGWNPLNVELGFPAGSNTVAIFTVSGTTNVNRGSMGAETHEGAVLNDFHTMAAYMRIPNPNLGMGGPGTPGVVFFPRGAAQEMADVGWSKEAVKQLLWENSKIPWSTIEAALSLSRRTRQQTGAKDYYPLVEGEPWPITANPENITIVVAGGAQSGHMYWMQIGNTKQVVSKEIKLPANWEELLKEAEEDLGPLPAAM